MRPLVLKPVKNTYVARISEFELALDSGKSAPTRDAYTCNRQVRFCERGAVEGGVEDVTPGKRSGPEAGDRAGKRLRSVAVRPARLAIDLLTEVGHGRSRKP